MFLLLLLFAVMYIIGLPTICFFNSRWVFRSLRDLLQRHGPFTKVICLCLTLVWVAIAAWQAAMILNQAFEDHPSGPSFDMRGLNQGVNMVLLKIPFWFVCLGPSFFGFAAVLLSAAQIGSRGNEHSGNLAASIGHLATGPHRLYFFGAILIALAVLISPYVWLKTTVLSPGFG
jgi:hypothetical protein